MTPHMFAHVRCTQAPCGKARSFFQRFGSLHDAIYMALCFLALQDDFSRSAHNLASAQKLLGTSPVLVWSLSKAKEE